MALYGRWFFPSLLKDLMKPVSREACLVGSQTMDDLGLWCNYGQLHRDFCTMYTKGYFKKYLPEEEYKSIDWSKIDNPDPRILQDILPRIAYRKGEFGRWMGETTPVMLEHFGLTEDEWKKNHDTLYWSVGHPKHHGNENDGQIGTVLNCMYNRDPMSHGHINFSTSGLPLELQREIAAKFWGDGSAVDGIGDYRPTNKYKMIRLRWVIARKELHDMLGICSWTAPWELSPLRERGYIGDIGVSRDLTFEPTPAGHGELISPTVDELQADTDPSQYMIYQTPGSTTVSYADTIQGYAAADLNDAPLITDDVYRIMIKARIIQDIWKGNVLDLYDMWHNLFPESLGIQIQDLQDMSFNIVLVGRYTGLMQELILHGYIIPKPEGVRINMLSFVDTDGLPIFAYDYDTLNYSGYQSHWLQARETE